jgi:hypothetical protein
MAQRMTVTTPKLSNIVIAVQANWTRRHLGYHPPLFLWLAGAIVAALAMLPLGYLIIRAAEAGSDKVWHILLRPRTHQIVSFGQLLPCCR